MASANGYIAKTGAVIGLLVGNYIDGFRWEFKYKATGLPYDFSAVNAIGYRLRIYDKRTNGRVLMTTIASSVDDVDGGGPLVQAGGFITWDGLFPTELNFHKYSFELAYLHTDAPTLGKMLSVGAINSK